MRWRQRDDQEWLDCESPAWLLGYRDGFEARGPDGSQDGGSRFRLSIEQRNYRDGFATGQSERELNA